MKGELLGWISKQKEAVQQQISISTAEYERLKKAEQEGKAIDTPFDEKAAAINSVIYGQAKLEMLNDFLNFVITFQY